MPARIGFDVGGVISPMVQDQKYDGNDAMIFNQWALALNGDFEPR